MRRAPADPFPAVGSERTWPKPDKLPPRKVRHRVLRQAKVAHSEMHGELYRTNGRWSGSVRRPAIRRRSGSTLAAISSRGASTSGPAAMMSRATFPGPGTRPIAPSRRHRSERLNSCARRSWFGAERKERENTDIARVQSGEHVTVRDIDERRVEVRRAEQCRAAGCRPGAHRLDGQRGRVAVRAWLRGCGATSPLHRVTIVEPSSRRR